MNEEQLSHAERLYKTWPTAELVQAATVERQDYDDQALNLMTRELARRGVSKAEKASIRSQFLRWTTSQKKALTGIRGSLLFFVVMLGLGSALLAFAGWTNLSSGGFDNTLRGIFNMVLACYGFLVFYLLVRKRSAAPQHARWFVIIVLLFEVLAAIQIWNDSDHLGPTLIDRTKGVLFWLFWLLWLESSPRIASTYGQSRRVPSSDDGPNCAT